MAGKPIRKVATYYIHNYTTIALYISFVKLKFYTKNQPRNEGWFFNSIERLTLSELTLFASTLESKLLALLFARVAS